GPHLRGSGRTGGVGRRDPRALDGRPRPAARTPARPRRVARRGGLGLVIAIALLATACDDSSGTPSDRSTTTTPTVTTTTTAVPLGPAIVFNAQSSRLDAYATTKPFTTQTVV